MKRFLIGVMFSFVLVSSNATAWSLSWESVTSWNREKIDTIKYNLDAGGNDLRAYEWVTPTMPYQKCIFVASENNTQLQCDLITNEQYKEHIKQIKSLDE